MSQMPLESDQPLEVRIERLEGSYEQLSKRLSNFETQSKSGSAELPSETRNLRSSPDVESKAPAKKLRTGSGDLIALAVMTLTIALVLEILAIFGILD